MTGLIRDFRDLIIWQKAIALAKEIYTMTKKLPADERFGLTSQIRRAVVSISSNVAEGHTRQGREFAHFLSIARGSLAETESLLFLAAEIGYLSPEDTKRALNLAQQIRRMAAKITDAINSRRPPKKPPESDKLPESPEHPEA